MKKSVNFGPARVSNIPWSVRGPAAYW